MHTVINRDTHNALWDSLTVEVGKEVKVVEV